MPKTYEVADHEVTAMLDRVMEADHPRLREACVRVAVLMVRAPVDDEGVPKSPAITVGGWPAKASIRITSLRDRALGMADAVIEIDGYIWDEMNDEEQEALLDHEMQHIDVTISEDDKREVKSDSCDRPVLSMRKHDVVFEGFSAVMKRRGTAAPEKSLLDAAVETMKRAQLALPGVTETTTVVTKRGRAGRAADAIGAAVEAVDDLIEDAVRTRPRTRGVLESIPGGAS